MIRFFSALALVLGFSSAHAMETQSANEIMKLLAGAMVIAQPQWGQPCGRSSECAFGESCVNYKCTPNAGEGCFGDYQCPVGERCIGNFCRATFTEAAEVRPMGCVSSSDCPPGDSCVRGQCVFQGGGGCVGDADCPVGEHCRRGTCGN